MLEKIKLYLNGDPELEDWSLRYDAACVKRGEARAQVAAAKTLLAAAQLNFRTAEAELYAITAERIDLRENLPDRRCVRCMPPDDPFSESPTCSGDLRTG